MKHTSKQKYQVKIDDRKYKEKLDFQAKVNFNKLGFICQSILPILDDLVDTNQARFGLKKAIKDFIRETEKVTKDHSLAYLNYGNLKQDDKEIDAFDIYNQTAQAYDWILELLTRPHNEILAIKALIDQYLESGKSLEDVVIKFEPLKK